MTPSPQPHSHSGRGDGGDTLRGIESLETRQLNNQLYGTEYDGADLGAKVANAIDDLPDNDDGFSVGQIIIPPKAGGGNWTWSTPVSVDPTTEAPEIIVGSSVNIDVELASGEWMFTADTRPSTGYNFRDPVGGVVGGHWDMSGSTDPAGLIRVIDTVSWTWKPANVLGCNNSSTDATVISLENHEEFTENNVISVSGTAVCDRFLNTQYGSETSGSGGTDSFHGTYVANVATAFQDYAMRFTGVCKNITVVNAELFGNADGAAAFELTRGGALGHRGLTIAGGKIEGTGSNKVAFRVGAFPDYDDFYPPLVVNFDSGGATDIEEIGGGSSGQVVPGIRSANNGMAISGWGGGSVEVLVDSIVRNEDGPFEFGTDGSKVGDSSGNARLVSGSGGASVQAGDVGGSSTGDNRVELRPTENGTPSWAWSLDQQHGQIPLLSSAPTSPSEGDYYFDDGTNTTSGEVAMRIYDGTAWVDQN